jgi:hypothetical protein
MHKRPWGVVVLFNVVQLTATHCDTPLWLLIVFTFLKQMSRVHIKKPPSLWTQEVCAWWTKTVLTEVCALLGCRVNWFTMGSKFLGYVNSNTYQIQLSGLAVRHHKSYLVKFSGPWPVQIWYSPDFLFRSAKWKNKSTFLFQ